MTAADETRRAFLAAIIANPDDDLPRVMLADFLDEHGGNVLCRRCGGSGQMDWHRDDGEPGRDPCPDCGGGGSVPDADRARAEFIRVQCELTVLPAYPESCGCADNEFRCSGCRRTQDLRRREWELFPAVWPIATVRGNIGRVDEWAVIFPGLGDWSRGFPSRLSVPWPFFRDHHASILKSCPIRGPNVGTQEEPRYEQPAKGGLVRLATPPLAGAWVTSTPYLTWLESEFPGVRFELPSPAPDAEFPAAITTVTGDMGYTEVGRRILGEIIRSQALPRHPAR